DDDPKSAESQIPIATIRREETDLTFAWAQPFADDRIRSQLANCLLEVSLAGETRMIQCREPLTVSPLVLDLQEGSQAVELDVSDTPPSSRLCLKIKELAFARGANVRGGSDT